MYLKNQQRRRQMPQPNNCINNNYKLCFKLKQHTPMIHFQYDQKGATLRASELKPKLDRFLIDKLNLRTEEEQSKHLFIGQGKEHLALDYKVKITSSGKRIDWPHKSLFFANNLLDKKVKSVTHENIKIEFISFHPQLISGIESWIDSFFAMNCFGMRQSKGFGSFYRVESESVVDFEIALLKVQKNIYKFSVASHNTFDSISYFYKMLRSGINECRKNTNGDFVSIFYGKSLLWLYAKGQKWMWDKKAIKKYFFNAYRKENLLQNHPNSDIMCYTSKGYLLRDLLGLSTNQSWREPYWSTVLKEDKETDEEGKPVIKRFKSPIQFKPIKTESGYDIYFWANAIPLEMLESTFEIKIEGNNEDIEELSPPRDFDIEKYMKFVLKFARDDRLSSHIDSNFHNNPSTNIYTILDEVFSSLEEVQQ